MTAREPSPAVVWLEEAFEYAAEARLYAGDAPTRERIERAHLDQAMMPRRPRGVAKETAA